MRFRQGMKAAIPIWIAFVPSSIAWGIAAKDHGLSLAEVILMSAWVYSGPAQFAVLGPLAEGKSALQVLIAGFLDEPALFAHEHRVGAVFSRRKTAAAAIGVACDQRQQFRCALRAISKGAGFDCR